MLREECKALRVQPLNFIKASIGQITVFAKFKLLTLLTQKINNATLIVNPNFNGFNGLTAKYGP